MRGEIPWKIVEIALFIVVLSLFLVFFAGLQHAFSGNVNVVTP